MCTIQYIDGHKNVIADAFSCVFINPEVLPTLSDYISSKIDSLEPPASTNIHASISAPAHSEHCWDMHSAPVSSVISPAYTVNCLVVSSISGIYYRYLCYLLRYLGLFLFLFVYKDIHYASYSHASVHTLVCICHTVSYKSDMR